MATVKVTDLWYKFGRMTQDNTGVRWGFQEFLNWINEAHLQVVNKRPDAKVVTASFSCQRGTLQELPANAIRFGKVIRNMDGRKRAITAINVEWLDEQVEYWHDDTNVVSEAQHYVYDNTDPTRFYLYPPVANGTNVLASYTVAPSKITILDADIDTSTQTIHLDDTYAPAILDWVLYRAYSKDTQYAGNGSRAQGHYQAFYHGLGIKLEGDSGYSMNSADKA
ncbi:hypothetical protein J7384_17835 [Endozoicomonas sp. G2_1]|uniref:phage adaptor protein n=1 Tax=Endozoicomonas sp. G2_1 TaxID=2821091 RepID=UPI001ADAFFB2|nr:DUF6682 family protein [Endozoicomonas sp. G2_1]MBO9492227.1 hypothetical protein [Endozoicomonas sp. G2_1]